MDVIRKTAAERNNRLIIADADEAEITSSSIYGSEFRYNDLDISIKLPGEHMIRNAVTALNVLFALRDKGLNIKDNIIESSFREVTFPARMEVLSSKPLIILDGAHNPDGIKALADALKKYLPDRRKVAVIGMLADKDVKTALSQIVPLFDTIFTTEPDNPRKMTSYELADVISEYCKQIIPCDSIEKAYTAARSHMPEDSALIICGSLYLASDMRKLITEGIINHD